MTDYDVATEIGLDYTKDRPHHPKSIPENPNFPKPFLGFILPFRFPDFYFMRFTFSALLALFSVALFSCEKEQPTNVATIYRHQVYNYSFNKGQVQNKPRYYNQRVRLDSMWARVILDELPLQQTRIAVELHNAPEGTGFPVNVRRVDTTYWGYDYTPDAAVFSRVMMGKGLGSVVVDTNRSVYSFDDLTKMYDGYFVVQDPIAPNDTLRIDTFSSAVFPVFGTFAR